MTRRDAVLVFTACVLPRAAALAMTSAAEPNVYWRLADSLLTTRRFALDGAPTGAFEPLYPAFLAATRSLVGDGLLANMSVQVALASIAGVLLFSLTLRKTGSRTAAWMTALCYAFYPYYVRQSVTPIALTLSLFLLIGAAWQADRTVRAVDAARLGLWLALLLLLRVMYLPLWGAVLIILGADGKKRQAIVVAAVTVAIVSPWAIASRANGRTLIPVRLGENLYVSTCPPADEIVPYHDVDLTVWHAHQAVGADRIAAPLDGPAAEWAVDEALLRAALRCAAADPLRTAKMKLENFAHTFSPVLLPADARVPRPRIELRDGAATVRGAMPRPWYESRPHLVAHAAITVAAMVGLWRRRNRLREDAVVLAMLANTTFVYTIFFPTTRLLAPTTFVLMVYAGVGLTATIAAGRRRR